MRRGSDRWQAVDQQGHPLRQRSLRAAPPKSTAPDARCCAISGLDGSWGPETEIAQQKRR
jgi:hypothetical protein